MIDIFAEKNKKKENTQKLVKDFLKLEGKGYVQNVSF